MLLFWNMVELSNTYVPFCKLHSLLVINIVTHTFINAAHLHFYFVPPFISFFPYFYSLSISFFSIYVYFQYV